jgi:S1-C subfamily serine protease
MHMNAATVIVAIGMLGLSGCMSTSAAAEDGQNRNGALTRKVSAGQGTTPLVVDDASLYAAILKSGVELIDRGQTTKTATLIEQLKRKRCSLKLTAQPTRTPLHDPSLYTQRKGSVLVFAGLFKCKQCPDWHAGCSSGFVLTEGGVAVTNYHVVNHPESTALVTATADGRVLPVKAVLAASEADDIAIVQLGGGNLQAIPLLADAEVGSKVSVIGHPSGKFYTLSEGIVSRYYLQKDLGAQAQRMAITADFAIGSSGGPVFDECGNAVGMVAGTESIYYTRTNGVNDNLQMVLKYCVPASSVLRLIELTASTSNPTAGI